MQNSIQFQTGDYVRTSKGNVGIVERPQQTFYRRGENYYSEAEVHYFGGSFVKELQPNLILLGDKCFPIWSDKLTKLSKLKVRTQQGLSQHVVELPIEDAKILIGIYKRNNIWFSVE